MTTLLQKLAPSIAVVVIVLAVLTYYIEAHSLLWHLTKWSSIALFLLVLLFSRPLIGSFDAVPILSFGTISLYRNKNIGCLYFPIVIMSLSSGFLYFGGPVEPVLLYLVSVYSLKEVLLLRYKTFIVF